MRGKVNPTSALRFDHIQKKFTNQPQLLEQLLGPNHHNTRYDYWRQTEHFIVVLRRRKDHQDEQKPMRSIRSSNPVHAQDAGGLEGKREDA